MHSRGAHIRCARRRIKSCIMVFKYSAGKSYTIIAISCGPPEILKIRYLLRGATTLLRGTTTLLVPEGSNLSDLLGDRGAEFLRQLFVDEIFIFFSSWQFQTAHEVRDFLGFRLGEMLRQRFFVPRIQLDDLRKRQRHTYTTPICCIELYMFKNSYNLKRVRAHNERAGRDDRVGECILMCATSHQILYYGLHRFRME